MPEIGLIRTFLQQHEGSGSRSTALKPLGWLLSLMAIFFTVALRYVASKWVLAVLLAFIGVSILVYLGAYLFLMIKNPDALRSEKFTLQKIAMERSQIGDNNFGFGHQALDPSIEFPQGLIGHTDLEKIDEA